MSLRKEDVPILAEKLQISSEKLQELLSDEKELELESLGIPVTDFLTKEQRDTLASNKVQEGIGLGKKSNTEMQVKALKKKYEDIEFESIDDLLIKLEGANKAQLDIALETQKTELGTGTDDRILLLKKEKEDINGINLALKKTIETSSEKHTNELLSMKTQFLMQSADNEILSAIGSLKFEVPNEVEKAGDEAIIKYLSVKKQNAFNIFKTQYQTEFNEEGKPIYKQGESIVRDNSETPLSVDKFINDFAKVNYLDIKKETTRGRAGKSSGSLITGLKGCKTVDDLNSYMEEKGIKQNTDDADKLYIEWKKIVNP